MQQTVRFRSRLSEARLWLHLFIKRTWSGVHPSHARLIDHANAQVVMNTNLARETHVVCEFSLHGETISLEFAHFTGIARENFNAAGRAAGVATTTVENVDSGVLDNEN